MWKHCANCRRKIRREVSMVILGARTSLKMILLTPSTKTIVQNCLLERGGLQYEKSRVGPFLGPMRGPSGTVRHAFLYL